MWGERSRNVGVGGDVCVCGRLDVRLRVVRRLYGAVVWAVGCSVFGVWRVDVACGVWRGAVLSVACVACVAWACGVGGVHECGGW